MNHPEQQNAIPEQSTNLNGPRPFRTLRAWPAVLLALLMLASRFGPTISPDAMAKYWMVSVFGPLLCCLLLLIWWLAASRATWRERVFGLLGIIAGAAVAVTLAHPTMRGAATTYLTVPLGFFVFALAAILLKKAPPARRTGSAVLLAFVGFASSMLLRTEGMTGDYKFAWRSRWSPTAEEAMLASTPKAPSIATTSTLDRSTLTNALAHPEWPGFRGADRDGRYLGPKISTNWSAQPPQQLWKTQVGPAWSSFAVAGRMLFTQEQLGPKEAVVCYDADTGKEIWKTEVEGRLEDPMGGPGPRATPTLADGALYVCASTGAFLRLNPMTGEIVWKKELPKGAARSAMAGGPSAKHSLLNGLNLFWRHAHLIAERHVGNRFHLGALARIGTGFEKRRII